MDAIATSYASANGVRLAYETFGRPSDPAVLLIHGMATQMLGWPDSMCRQVAGEGYFVVRYDHRDIGLSEKLTHLFEPNVTRVFLFHRLRLPVRVPYRLGDMAEDAVGLLDHLKLERAHIVGVSMGGMISHHIAAKFSHRMLSMTSVMSSSGARKLPPPEPHILALLNSMEASADREKMRDHALAFLNAISSPDYPPAHGMLEDYVDRCGARCPPGEGFEMRHLAAVIADGSRVRLLQRIKVPTLVLHGDRDPLIPLACGKDTARHIPGARLRVIAGWAHDLPEQLVGTLCEELGSHFAAATA